jgi:hypothetical protein
MGIISYICSLPFQWIFGAFLTPIYDHTLEKYLLKKKIKGLFDKEGTDAQEFEK